MTVAELMLPASGFVELLTDAGGAPGERLALAESRVAGTYEDITIELDEPLTGETVLWVRAIIDFDEDGTVTAVDPVGVIELDGAAAGTSFIYTVPEEDDEEDGEEDGE